MNIQVSFRNLKKNSAASRQVNHRLYFAFSKAQDAIQSISVIVSDVKGATGGIDKLCRILIKSNELSDIVVSETQANMAAAIDRCIARARQSLSRKLKSNQQSLQQRVNLQQLPPASHRNLAY